MVPPPSPVIRREASWRGGKEGCGEGRRDIEVLLRPGSQTERTCDDTRIADSKQA